MLYKQVEVVVFLMAIKCLYPNRVFLVRGNHEFRDTSESQGASSFKSNILRLLPHMGGTDSYASLVYAAIFDMFEYLPIAAVVNDRMLVIHGGIGDGSWGLRDLEYGIQRPLVSAHVNPIVMQALWSDPSDSDAEMARGVHGNPRGANIATFGPDITEKFCQRENLDVIVRSHQYVLEGFKCMHSGHLITLFSARDYLQQASRSRKHTPEHNCGALLLACPDESGAIRLRFKVLRGQ